MTVWDIVVVALMIGTGVALWFYGNCDGVTDWAIKFLIAALMLFGPYFFWDDIGAYWRSSDSGPINIETGWW